MGGAIKVSITCGFMVNIRYGFVTDPISICTRSVITIRYTSFDKSTATDPISSPSDGSVKQSVPDEYLICYGFFFWLCRTKLRFGADHELLPFYRLRACIERSFSLFAQR